MRKGHRWLWIILFIGVTLLLGILATGWNVVLVRDYQHLLTLARKLVLPIEANEHFSSLMVKMIAGTLGFIAALALTVLIFIKLLNEMRLNQLQSEFLATVSHELKTPIAAMELSSSLIQAGGLSPNDLERLWLSHDNELKRLREEVDTLLEAARWQSHPSAHKKTPLHLESWIAQSIPHWQMILGPNGTLQREGDAMDFQIRVDPQTLRLITNNLLSNSKKFSRGNPHVTIRTSRISPRWQIQFEDQGWGFNPIDSKKIFQKFFRSRNSAPYAIPGTGLGLYLAHAACQAMKLTLNGKSEGTGLGAIFTLEGLENLK